MFDCWKLSTNSLLRPSLKKFHHRLFRCINILLLWNAYIINQLVNCKRRLIKFLTYHLLESIFILFMSKAVKTKGDEIVKKRKSEKFAWSPARVFSPAVSAIRLIVEFIDTSISMPKKAFYTYIGQRSISTCAKGIPVYILFLLFQNETSTSTSITRC